MVILAKALAKKAHVQKASRNAPSKKIPNPGGTSGEYRPQQADGTLDVGLPSRSISGWLPCQAEDSSYE
jgi:hypothetical protein